MAAAEAPSSLLLVVGGECGCRGPLAYVLEELERGVRSWDVDPSVCTLDEQLKVFVSRHSATFSSIVKGQRSLHHRGETLETLVLLNPSDRSLCDELRNLLLDPAPHKLLVLAGPCLEDTGDLLLQTGGFSPHHFLQVLEDREVQDALASSAPATGHPTLTIICPTFGDWAQLAPNLPGLQLRLNPPSRLPASEGLREFLEYLAESLEPPSPFDLLEPPSFGGFLRLTAPCCYIFPGGLGDAAFFAVNGFTVLVNGGSNPKSSFWKLVRHLDRVDAVLVTHAGMDSLPGLNSLLRRKVAERGEVEAGDQQAGNKERGVGYPSGGSWRDHLRRLVSPALGIVFLNAREAASRLMRGPDEAALALGLLAQLGIEPLLLRRGPQPAKPTVLFRKMGVGRLDLYVLHPPEYGDEAGDLDRGAGSVCALLVWLPAGPTEKVVRVLFPGRTPPARLLEGLLGLQHLAFLREPVVTPRDLEAPPRVDSRESLGSRDGVAKRESRSAGPTPSRPSTERPMPARKELARANPPHRAEKETRLIREVKKDPKLGAPRSQPQAPASTPSLKKAASAPRPRRAPGTPQPATRLLRNGPRSPPALVCGEPSPPGDQCPSPATQLPSSSEGCAEAVALEQEPAAIPERPPSPPPSSPGGHRSPERSRLSLSPLRGGDASPTGTTPSLPAEVGSPHSTEVDESLSTSFEQALPLGDAGLSLPLRGPRAHRSTSPHDVDLCLVSPCEFEHRKALPAAALPTSPGSSDGSSRSQERAGPEETPPTSVSESLPTLSDSDPLPAGPAPDSEDDTRARDPLPEPLHVPLPLTGPASTCMVDPAMPAKSARQMETSRSRRPPAGPSSATTTSKATSTAASRTKVHARADRASRPPSARSEPGDKGARVPLTRKPSAPKTSSRGPAGTPRPTPAPVYLDLAYLPGGAGQADVEFFLRVRALCYIISGRDRQREEGLRSVLDALLAGKQGWERDLQVTLIPTFDSATMHQWYEETHAQHQALGVTVLGSNSMVSMQDEAFPACKVEF
ncbi:microtubule-associated protein 1S isoform X2 [Perognathus longimembris pacificus]|uniref:microtubule-associated protein 1S isoform X2 n=1 Tax=Perognathus longimembris pacificus TaxID=214514 RepID=UPI002019CE82|nr:microtubule-associated protein 1S isoform X2 [Perognathus longimembris pacificus]